MEKSLENLKSLVTRGMIQSISAYKELFSSSPEISIALAYLNSATSYFAAAEALYYSNVEYFDSQFTSDIFERFSIFEKEFLQSVQKNHSHQWTDIEFQHLRNSFMSSPFAFENEDLFP